MTRAAEPTLSDLVTRAMERYESPLIRYAASILGDVERAREVVQDTFLKLCTQETAQVEKHLSQWLFTVCRNQAFDVRKKEGRMSSLNDIDLAVIPGTGPRPLALVERQEQVERILELVSSLPESQREVLTLKFQCELSYKEISAITHLSVGNVGFLLHMGLKRIREQIKAEPSPTPSLVRRLQ